MDIKILSFLSTSILLISLIMWNSVSAPINAEKLFKSNLSITTLSNVTQNSLGQHTWNRGSGSGFLVNSDTCEGWTNYHVVKGAAFINIFGLSNQGNKPISAKVIAFDQKLDIAIFKMEYCNDILPVTFGNSNKVKAGDIVYSVGNPLSINPNTITKGIVSSINRNIFGFLVKFFQIDAAINPGNSGGGLFNVEGELIGINSAIAASSIKNRSPMGIAYSIPITPLIAKIKRLKKYGNEWGTIGLEGSLSSLYSDEIALLSDIDINYGMIINKTLTGGNGKDQLKVNDLIYQINNKPFKSHLSVIRTIHYSVPGSVISLDIIRNRKTMNINLVVANDWVSPTSISETEPEFYNGYMGMDLEEWESSEDSSLNKIKHPVITRVYNLGPAHAAGIMHSETSIFSMGSISLFYKSTVVEINGIILHSGKFYPINSIDDITRYVNMALKSGASSVLLRIGFYVRKNNNPSQDFYMRSTQYYRIELALSRGIKVLETE